MPRELWLNRAVVFLAIECAACIPVPTWVRDTPAITGGIMVVNAYASGLEVASIPEPEIASVPQFAAWMEEVAESNRDVGLGPAIGRNG